MAFGERINDTVDWIQTKIGKHDQAVWEQQAAKKLKDFPTTFTTKRTKLKNELIDVDLIRGTNFDKPKPVYNWTDITFFGLLKLFFLPIYYKWWIDKTSLPMFCTAVVLWVLQLIMAVLMLNVEQSKVDEVLLGESLTPFLLWLVVGLTFCQAVATDMKKAQKSGISTLIKKSKIPSSNSTSKLTTSTTKPVKLSGIKTHNKSFTKKVEASNLRRRAVIRNSENLKTISTTSSSSLNGLDAPGNISELSETDHFLTNNTNNFHNTVVNNNLKLDEHQSTQNSDSDVSPTKDSQRFLSEKSCLGFKSQKNNKTKDSDSESELERTQTRRRGRDSSSESEHETDSSEHNGMTESMWTESETDSRTPLFKARKPPFSTINENNSTCDTNSKVDSLHHSSTDNDTTDRLEQAEARASTPSTETRTDSANVHRDSLTDHNLRTERIRVKVWLNEELVKVEMSPLEIGYQIIFKVEGVKPSLEYAWLGVILSFTMSILPFVFRAHNTDTTAGFSVEAVVTTLYELANEPIQLQLIHGIGFILSMSLSLCFFTLFVVAERTYSQRYLYAKFFNAITSMRRAKQYGLPHFRLRSIQNIKAWLSLRSVLRRVGPYRSVGVIIASSFLIMLTILTVVCFQFFSKGGDSMKMYFTWLAIGWSMCLSIYLLRLFTLGNDIKDRFDNQSLLITEQINLFFFIQQSPQKKEQLMHANQVLQLSSKLLKEIDGRESSVFFLSPLVSQFLRVFLLSAFSGLASEILGFKLKLWKMMK